VNPVTKVYLCDDDPQVCKSLVLLLEPDMLTVSAHGSGPELLAAVDAAPQPFRGIFLLDQEMSPMKGSQVHAQLIARGLAHRSPVLFLSGKSTLSMAVEAMRKGAVTYLEKPLSHQMIVPWVHEALATEAQWFAKSHRGDQLRLLWERLPPRQKQIAPLVAKGQANKSIAWDIQRTLRMVEEHRKKLFANLGLKSASELATLLAEMRACGTGPGKETVASVCAPGAPGNPPR
jgi:two-component system, LuxR family, response regulator DctR